nr:MAG TPA: hypothetical protein [Caudoviricetes sp.]
MENLTCLQIQYHLAWRSKDTYNTVLNHHLAESKFAQL